MLKQPPEVLHSLVRRLPPPLFRLIRATRVRQSIASYRPRRIVGRFQGVPLTLSIEDALAEGWYASKGEHVWPEIAVLRDYGLVAGARAFDIGAHQAVVALVMAHLVGSTGEIIAVEGDGHNVEVAHRNVALNNANNLRVVHAACTDHSGVVTFHEGLNGRIVPGRLGNRKIRAVTIDELARRYGDPRVVFIDIEGHELAALRGARQTLTTGATFMLEVHAGGQLQATGGSVREIGDLLATAGYDLAILMAASLEPIRPAELPATGYIFLVAHRD